jgi:hypothetical protein
MLRRLSLVVLLVSVLAGCGYWYYRISRQSSNSFALFTKDYEFTPKQVKFLESIGVTPDDLSSMSTMLAFAPLIATKTAESAHEHMQALLQDPKVASLFATAYHCYRVPMDVSFKIIGSAFPAQVTSLVNKLNALLLESQVVGEIQCNPVGMFSDLQALINLGKFESLKGFWKEHGGLVSMAKDILPKPVMDMVDRFGKFSSITIPEPESDDKAKEEDKSGDNISK